MVNYHVLVCSEFKPTTTDMLATALSIFVSLIEITIAKC